jgi:hypothetical protein
MRASVGERDHIAGEAWDDTLWRMVSATPQKKIGTPLSKSIIIGSYHEHTPRGGGLARVAGQSCLAGPSVFQMCPVARMALVPGMVLSHAA